MEKKINDINDIIMHNESARASLFLVMDDMRVAAIDFVETLLHFLKHISDSISSL